MTLLFSFELVLPSSGVSRKFIKDHKTFRRFDLRQAGVFFNFHCGLAGRRSAVQPQHLDEVIEASALILVAANSLTRVGCRAQGLVTLAQDHIRAHKP